MNKNKIFLIQKLSLKEISFIFLSVQFTERNIPKSNNSSESDIYRIKFIYTITLFTVFKTCYAYLFFIADLYLIIIFCYT